MPEPGYNPGRGPGGGGGSGTDATARSAAAAAQATANAAQPKQAAPDAAKTAAFTLSTSKPNLVDISGGSFAATLPAAASAGAGAFVFVKVLTASATLGSTNLAVTPATGETINGGAANATVPMRYANQAKLLISDGGSNWNILAGDLDKTTLDALYISSATLAQTPIDQPASTVVPDSTVTGIQGDQRRVIPNDDIYQRNADGTWSFLAKGHKPIGLRVPSTKFVMPTTLASTTTGAMNSGRCCFMPFYVPTGGLTLSALAFRLTTPRVGGTGTLVKGAVYADAVTNALTGPMLSSGGILGQADFTATTLAGNGSKSVAFTSGTNLTLAEEQWVWFAGFYYAGTTAPSTSPQVVMVATAQSMWASPTFDASRYLYTTGDTDLPVAGETLNAGTETTSLGFLVGGVAA